MGKALIATCDLAPSAAGRFPANQARRPAVQGNPPEHRAEALKLALSKADPDLEFSMVYQPRICAASGRIRGVEALLRWDSPYLGSVPPSRLLPIAEESGAITWITDWTIQASCKAARDWINNGNDVIPVSVNLSAAACCNPMLIGITANALRSAQLPGNLLHFEIGDGKEVCRDPAASAAVEALRNVGVKVTVDGCRNGEKSFPAINALIGRVDDLRHRGQLQHVRTLASQLRVRTIAAGVESAKHLEFIRSLGFDEVQGFHISAPLSRTDLPRWIRSHSPG